VPGDIEFLPQDDVGPPEPDESPRPRRPVPRLAWLTLALVVTIALGAWALTRPDPNTRTSGMPVRPTATVIAPALPPEPARPAEQPAMITCIIGGRTEPAVATVLRTHLPGVAVAARAELRCARGIRDDRQVVYERVSAVYRTLHLVVDVGARGTIPTMTTPATAPGVLLMSVDTESAGLHVHVGVFGRPGAKPPLGAVQRVADDLSLNLVL
jgi:hypothetical protein